MEFFKGRPPLIPHINMDKKWAFPLLLSSLIFIFLLLSSFNLGLLSSLYTLNSTIFSLFNPPPSHNHTSSLFIEPKLSMPPPSPHQPMSTVPRLAYLVSGSRGDLDRLWRTLRALYHPNNLYVVHLDLESPAEERLELELRIANDSMYAKVGNVRMITKANMVTYRGPTMVANTLHACAILLRWSKDWDWFINLSASDYPLVTQDGES